MKVWGAGRRRRGRSLATVRTTTKVLKFLAKKPATAGEVGSVIDNRRGRVASVNGGGDYAAQMLLGRLRKKGLVRTLTTIGAGASVWELTPLGHRELA